MRIVVVVFVPVGKRAEDRPAFEVETIAFEGSPVLMHMEDLDLLNEVFSSSFPVLIHFSYDPVSCCSGDLRYHFPPPSSSIEVMPIAQ